MLVHESPRDTAESMNPDRYARDTRPATCPRCDGTGTIDNGDDGCELCTICEAGRELAAKLEAEAQADVDTELDAATAASDDSPVCEHGEPLANVCWRCAPNDIPF